MEHLVGGTRRGSPPSWQASSSCFWLCWLLDFPLLLLVLLPLPLLVVVLIDPVRVRVVVVLLLLCRRRRW